MGKYIEYLTFGTGMVGDKSNSFDNLSLSVIPNPVCNTKTIKFNIASSAKKLTVFDATGRNIAEWNLGNVNSILWNLSGKSVTPGTYFVRVIDSGIATTQSFVILR
jgi:hypothetical protein